VSEKCFVDRTPVVRGEEALGEWNDLEFLGARVIEVKRRVARGRGGERAELPEAFLLVAA
jgi:hypothetical protein